MTTQEKLKAIRDIIPIGSMGANNPRTNDRQTLYGDVLDWLRDNGYGKDHDLAVLIIGEYAIRNNWDGIVRRNLCQNLSLEDQQILKSFGYLEEDIQQIDKSYRVTEYKADRKKISAKKAREILGDLDFLSGLSRSSFHWSASRDANGVTISFDSSKLFR